MLLGLHYSSYLMSLYVQLAAPMMGLKIPNLMERKSHVLIRAEGAPKLRLIAASLVAARLAGSELYS